MHSFIIPTANPSPHYLLKTDIFLGLPFIPFKITYPIDRSNFLENLSISEAGKNGMLSYSKSFRSIRSHTENLYDRARRKLAGSFRHTSPNNCSSDNHFGQSASDSAASEKASPSSLGPHYKCYREEVLSK